MPRCWRRPSKMVWRACAGPSLWFCKSTLAFKPPRHANRTPKAAFQRPRKQVIVVIHNIMASSGKVDLYKNAALPAAKRVKDLLSRMSLEEKAAQMMCVWQEKAKTLVDEAGNFDPAKAKAAYKKGYGLGQVGRPSDAGKGKDARGNAELTNAIQKFFIE